MARITRHAQIILKQEALALDLLKSAENCDSLDMKMDLFERVGKWVSIKNKLENDDGGGIADYKRKLHAASGEADKHPAARRSGRDSQANGGARLNAIKSRIPAGNDGGSDRHGGDSGDEDAPPAGHAGSNGTGLHGNPEPGAVAAGGNGDL
jgi:hypothetical protein